MENTEENAGGLTGRTVAAEIVDGLAEDNIAKAAAVIRGGGLVAFPTETVYGLGADAFNPEAVAGIYSLKGRPPDNPLILHVENTAAVESITDEISENARKLMEKFWPGPLTLIFKKKPGLPGWVGGHPARTASTVALRAPSNPVAQALIKASGRAVAAPSANRAGTPSPTRAEHVLADFKSVLLKNPFIIIDGGETVFGLESTVADVTGSVPRVLRPGAVTVEMLEEALGCVVDSPVVREDGPPLSPGMKYRHYAPAAPMTLVCGEPEKAAGFIINEITRNAAGKKAGILSTGQTADIYRSRFQNSTGIFILNAGDRARPETIAHNLYNCLRQFDRLGVEIIFAEGVDESGLGQAIMNRMKKASEGRVVWIK